MDLTLFVKLLMAKVLVLVKRVTLEVHQIVGQNVSSLQTVLWTRLVFEKNVRILVPVLVDTMRSVASIIIIPSALVIKATLEILSLDANQSHHLHRKLSNKKF